MTPTTNPQRGEVWRVALDPVMGSEQAKTRPVIVMNAAGIGRPTMRVCVPVTAWQPVHDVMPWCVNLAPSGVNGLSKESTADASQVRALDMVRFLDQLGAVKADELDEIAAAVALCVGFDPVAQGAS